MTVRIENYSKMRALALTNALIFLFACADPEMSVVMKVLHGGVKTFSCDWKDRCLRFDCQLRPRVHERCEN